MSSRNLRINLLCILIAITIFSQITSIDKFFRPAMYAGWVLLLGVGVISNHFKIKLFSTLKLYAGLFITYVLYCAICTVLYGTTHLQSGYMSLLPIPLLIMLVADLFRRDFDEKSIRKLAVFYTLSVLVFSIWIHFTYFASYSNWLSFRGGYLFQTKNSAAQTISPAIYMIFFIIVTKENAGNKAKFLWYLIALYFLIVLGLCQARTSLLGLSLSLLIYALKYSRKKLQWLGGILVIALIAMQFSSVQVFVEKIFNIRKYAGADLNTISSGRVNQYIAAIRAFVDSPIIGQGKWYVDCSYLSILTESGIVGFLIIEPIWISKIHNNYKGYWYSREAVGNDKRNFVVLLTVFYIVESLLEAYPPFGPGVTSFGFWFFCEMIMCYGMNKEAHKYEEINRDF